MIEIAYMSDLHLEIHTRQPIPDNAMWAEGYNLLPYGPSLRFMKDRPPEVFVLAGDIGTFKQHIDYADELVRYLNCDVVSIIGNHEWYGKKFCEDTLNKRRPVNTRHHVLNRESVVLHGVRFLGCTLWTDFNATRNYDYVIRVIAPKILADFRFIEGMTPEVMRNENQKDRNWLEARLKEPFEGQTAVVTHNSPHSHVRDINYPPDDRSACFASDHEDLLCLAGTACEYPVWIYGHDHWSAEHQIYGVDILSAQYGYPEENTNWSGIGFLSL